ncbi:phosphoheptose isomerase [Sphaerisporangium melleum]|uniref:Phosphoheptose isomerase n=1 Tax=Sphaerisporangium melleum TaxID=321316 RepID=A0A917VNS9_9ACTN|nr:SIS domain-containing protein [Sphaerisporangium melleum]GGL03741.1 phosphoheptose isomerase [Sphaerisporangium melleum]GII74025.1 phosphoheptose isomerase [Sphaerisporangium melleum]
MHTNFSRLRAALAAVDARTRTIDAWGSTLAEVLGAGGRLLACGNGGSAAEAQHLTAELVGRFRADRRPYAAIALHADTSATTAIANDYGAEEVYARQVRAHGHPGDVLLCLSTSGASANVVAAAEAARECGLTTWALTGQAPNPLAAMCDEAVAVPSRDCATVQEVHLAVVHLLCDAFEAALRDTGGAPARAAADRRGMSVDGFGTPSSADGRRRAATPDGYEGSLG